MFEIEKCVPLAKSLKGRKRYPIDEMEVGDSFFAPITEANPDVIRSRLSAAVKYYRPKMFTMRMVKEDGAVTGFRVWRIQ